MKGSGIQMKKNLQKMQVKAINKRAILESHDGEEFSLITVAKNVLCEDGTTMQDYFDNHSEPNISTKIVNSNSMSKVGQGDNVDYSENVVDGAYESCVLKGQTLVNIFQFTSKDDFANSNALIIEGTAMKFNADGSYQNFWLKNNGLVKTNTDYLFIVDILENTLVYKDGTKDTDSVLFLTSAISGHADGNFFQHGALMTVSDLKSSTKRFIKKMTSNPTSTGTETLLTRGFLSPNAVSGTLKIKLMIIEYQEGMENWDLDYFEGLCDVKSPILSNVGKNLFNGESRVGYYIAETGEYNPTPTISQCCNVTPIQVSGGTKYSFLLPEGDMSRGRTFLYDSKMNFISSIINADARYVITTTQETKYINFHFDNATPELFSKVQLEESSTTTTYEPYKSNILSFEQKDGKTIVLRSLPNGVCDTLNVRTGEYVQNIGEIICDGSEDERWAYNIAGSGQGKKCFNLPSELTPHRKRFGYIICDCMPTTNTLDKIGVYNGEGLNILIDSDSNDVGVLKEILANKPITVQYELTTPIVKQVNVEGYPYAYENGHILLESGSQEQSLTPTIEYSIVANRGGQIRSNQRMVERHQKKLDSLYAMTLVNMIDSQYNQTLMELKSDLPKSEVRTWDIE